MSTTEFTQQLTSLNPVLRSFTKKFTSDRDESLDLVQDTLMKAFTNRDKFRKDTNFKGWLFTIMRNTYINNYRKQQREKTSNDTTKNLYFLNVEDTHTFNKPETNFEYHDIWKNVNELREELLTPFKLHTSGYKYEEIAEHLEIPLGTVKNRIFQARKEIQKKLAGY
jgi:RNA polymerase sigma factor (sigma-70 family)